MTDEIHHEELKFEIWKAYDVGFSKAYDLFDTLEKTQTRQNLFKNTLKSHRNNYVEAVITRLEKEGEK